MTDPKPIADQLLASTVSITIIIVLLFLNMSRIAPITIITFNEIVTMLIIVLFIVTLATNLMAYKSINKIIAHEKKINFQPDKSSFTPFKQIIFVLSVGYLSNIQENFVSYVEKK